MKYHALKQRRSYIQYLVYGTDVLNRLSQQEVFAQLSELSGGKDVALIYYEDRGNNCYRHLVAEWLGKAGVIVKEW